MMRLPIRWVVPAFAILAPLAHAAAPATGLRFEVALGERFADRPLDGRLLIVLDARKSPEPWQEIGEMGMDVAPVLGRDVAAMKPGTPVVVDSSAVLFPLANLGRLPRGEYHVQAILTVNREFQRIDAPGNLFSKPVLALLDPARGQVVRLTLTGRFSEPELEETDHVRLVRIRSEKLSRFHGRPFDLHACVLLPAGYDRDVRRRYPLWVRIGGFGTRCFRAADLLREGGDFEKLWTEPDTPRMIMLFLDGAGPFGDPYQVNSENNGPYGDAITQELIPYVEKKFRAIGEARARLVEGHSTGGWVSLALQVFYPDFFGGAWSHAPDPVDFRALELVNIYENENAYVNTHGFERPASRSLDGDVRSTMRHECLLERVLGRGGRWELSGKDWGSWNAAFGPRGADGLPRPLWDGVSGKIDREALEHWKRYDLRLQLQRNWRTLGPKLRGKLHIYVGEADDYFLNNAVHLLDDFLRTARPEWGGSIRYGAGRGHSWRGLTERELMEQMARSAATTKPD
jgi:hypothetical protein